MELNAKVPDGPLDKKWERRKFELKLVNPANKRKYEIIVVGSGLAGGARALNLHRVDQHRNRTKPASQNIQHVAHGRVQFVDRCPAVGGLKLVHANQAVVVVDFMIAIRREQPRDDLGSVLTTGWVSCPWVRLPATRRSPARGPR